MNLGDRSILERLYLSMYSENTVNAEKSDGSKKYNDEGFLVYERDDINKSENFYNDQGKLIQIKYDSGVEVRYDDNGTQTYFKNPSGVETFYNNTGAKIRTINPDGDEFRWDNDGDLIYSKQNGKVSECIKKYNEEGKLIYSKDMYGVEKKYNDLGKLIYRKIGNTDYFYNDKETLVHIKNNDDGSEKKYDENKVLVYSKDMYGNETEYKDGKKFFLKTANGYEYEYDSDDRVIYEKSPDGEVKKKTEEYDDAGNRTVTYPFSGEVFKYNDKGNLIYRKDGSGNEQWYNEDTGKMIRLKYSNGHEEKFNVEGEVIYRKTIDGTEEFFQYDEYGIEITKERKIAEKKAENYMRDYHGLFLHSLHPSSLTQLLELKDSNSEVCVSTVRSSTVFRSEDSNIVIIGFGAIRELYDFDAYSETIKNTGRRYSTKSKSISQTPELHNIRRAENLKKHHEEFNEDNYYDEGFMPWNSAEVLIASVPDFGNESKRDVSHPLSTPELIKRLKTAYPDIKIITPKEFSKLKTSENLLTLAYNTKQENEDTELMSRPFHKYEESKLISFKNYFILENKVPIPLNVAYYIFKKEYDKSTGISWDYNKFMNRAANWEFYGDVNGYVAIRRQRSGFVKLVGMAGNNKSKLKGIQDLVSMNLPLWGLVSKEIKDIAVRKGMREPNFLERQALKRSISPEVLGGAEILDYQSDGGIKLKYPDVGVVVKYMVGTPLYYSELRKKFTDKLLGT